MLRLLSILLVLLCSVPPADSATRKKRTKKSTKTTAKVVKTRPTATPRTSGPWIVRPDGTPAPDGLDGRNIALWASHGRYYDSNEQRWTWQRSRLLGTVEDLYTLSYVYPLLAPMLENAGATVIMPRERDTSEIEVVIDGDGSTPGGSGYAETNGRNAWSTAEGNGGFRLPAAGIVNETNPFRNGSLRQVSTVKDPAKASSAVWTVDMPERGEYAVYVSYASLPKSATDALYRVTSMRGTEEIHVNQTMAGGTWVYLGTYPLDKGKTPVVELLNVTDGPEGTVVTADAVKIGGGNGTVARGDSSEKTVSGYPRFTEGARYWLQYAGFPKSVWSVSGGTSDYEDDLKSRGAWVNYMAGGSKTLPGFDGLGVPVDLSFALHSDAGVTSDATSTIGTLPIVSTSGGTLGDGRSRKTSQQLATTVTDQIVDDIRYTFDPGWNRRKLRDKAYHEAREPLVPAMLLELLSHQNYADMTKGLDPGFRFLVSRSIYKGILKYLHQVSGTPYVVTPLPVNSFVIASTSTPGEYRLSWLPTADRLEPSAKAEYYIVYERINDGAFTELAIIDDPTITVTPETGRIYSYRIVAANKGGISFPSETLALCDMGEKSRGEIEIVNGFTRVSGPAEVYSDDHAGFDYEEDMGVPYISDIHFTGAQTEFRRSTPWINNDAPGHGASRANHETSVIAGNTFDFVYVHGQAVRDAGYSFVSSSLAGFVTSDSEPRIVDLILGKQREILSSTSPESNTRFKAFTPELRERLTSLASSGTALLVSGSYIGSDLFDNPYSQASTAEADRRFGHEVLGIDWRQAKATITGKVKEVACRFAPLSGNLSFKFNQELSSDCYAVESPETFGPSSSRSGAVFLRYTENDYAAATAYVGDSHRAIAMGFPFETILDPSKRSRLMGQMLDFLSQRGSLASADFKVIVGNLIAQQPPSLPPVTEGWDISMSPTQAQAYLREGESSLNYEERRHRRRRS
ncbi:MAG: xanthan lyase [Bacteroides sp.]|nr:xanthan lyase [Bacteroides sp.]